ncbi:MAG: 16S rRNA (guanine(527)-N(7))-methyltransferase RsmG [Anaerolineaceae bacterium]|nr:16S rRNA (guanine(527)-N(7))-methyltransferase RsmG [Anaerolineaceae bacterium]
MTDLQTLCAEKLNLKLSQQQVSAFSLYEKELLEWNEKFNLTAIRDAEGVRVKHFLDSLTCIQEMKNIAPNHLIDVGTGAGFPGIPLKLLFPAMHLTLVESVGKKANFCQHMVETLKLENVQILTLRAEEVGQLAAHREKYDWALARAVANLPILLEYLLPLVRVGGAILAQKGETAHAEAQTAEKASRILGGRLKHITPLTLPGVVEERFLVVYEKIAATPPQYPRRVGIPSKNPL